MITTVPEPLTCSPHQLVLHALFDAVPLTWPDALALLDSALDALHELSLPD
jgi:hypothetical protein